jgi:hypothetical protein
VEKSYIDLGQGILDCIHDIYKEVRHYPTVDGLIIEQENKR